MHTLFPFSVEARSLYRGVSLFGVVPSQIAGLPHLRTGSRVARELVQLRGMASAGALQFEQVVQPQSVPIRPPFERPQRVLHRVDEGQLLASMQEIARRGYSAERFANIYHYRQLAPEFIRGKYGSKSNTEFRDAYNACHYALMKAVDHEFSPLLVSGGSVTENPGLAFAQLEWWLMSGKRLLVIPLNPSNEPPISRLPDAMLIPFDENGRLISSNSHIMLGRVDGGYLMLELKLTGEKGSKSLMFKHRASLSEADVI